MARSPRKPKSRRVATASTPGAPAPAAPPPRRPRPLFWTLATVLVAPFVVMIALAFATATPGGRSGPLTDWTLQGKRLHIGDQPVGLNIGRQPVLLSHTLTGTPGLDRLTFDLDLERPIEPRVVLVYHDPATNTSRGLNVGDQVRHTGRNTVVVSADDVPGLLHADVLAIQIASPQGANRVAISRVRGSRAGAATRFFEILRRLGRAVPLTQGGNNFIASTMVAGHGTPYILWWALALALAVLALRRWALSRPVPVIRHALVTVLVIFVLADLHNWVDETAQARTAIDRRVASHDLVDYLGRLEAGFPWFAPSLRYVEGLPAGRSYHMMLHNRPGVDQARRRLMYYAQPKPYADRLDRADVVLSEGPSASLAADPHWKHVTDLAGDIVVYERQP